MDTLVDVVGVSWGLWKLEIETVTASAVNAGRVAPASFHLIRQFKIPVLAESPPHELATPTGIAILSEIAERFGPMPAMVLEKAGYGAGAKDYAGRPNVVSIYRGRAAQSITAAPPVLLLETVIDDMDPRLYPHVCELLLQAGALDVWWAAVGMKKGRPGFSLHVLADPSQEATLTALLFRESTTLGIRRQILDRWVLPRDERGLRKVARLPNGSTKTAVEYEVARRLALKHGTPLRKLLK
jgi:uncharacterized protein (DUF111 family)